jgi:Arc/MetJ-type ribon-helix-helix transcriptional regulator
VKPTFKTMTNINISVPESLKSFLDHQIAEGGYSSASEYLQQLIILLGIFFPIGSRLI